MKNLKTYLEEGLGFTVDDELAAEYIYAFETGDWDTMNRIKDIDMWWSMGVNVCKEILQRAKFTGCLGEDTNELEVVKMGEFNHLHPELCQVVSNAEGGKNPIDPDYGHFVICYKGHEPIYIPDLDSEDWKKYEYAINPRAKWRNVVNKTNLEWIIWNDVDEVWIKNSSSYDSLIKYTGWSIWENGKLKGGKLSMQK